MLETNNEEGIELVFGFVMVSTLRLVVRGMQSRLLLVLNKKGLGVWRDFHLVIVLFFSSCW